VAQEVKALAAQTAKATADIAARIGAVQASAIATGQSIGRIGTEVAAQADQADVAGRAVVDSAKGVEVEARTLGAELDAFLVAVRDLQERRKYERIPGNGMQARATGPGGERGGGIIDISRGGVSVSGGVAEWPSGTAVTILLPGVGEPVRARLVRHSPGGAAFSFRQDAASLHLADRAMDVIGQRRAA